MRETRKKNEKEIQMIRDNIKPGDSVYSWRHQGYIKVAKVIRDNDIALFPVIECSLMPFANTCKTYSFEGKLCDFYDRSAGITTDKLTQQGDFHIFNDLDEYYEFVKATTNTPIGDYND